MELETLRLTFQADTGSAAANLKTLEKMILAQVRAMNAATNASKEHESVSARQIAMAAQVAAKAAQTSLALTEQAKRTAASAAAFKAQSAQMKQSAEASARLSTSFRTSLKAQSETQSMTAKVMQMTHNYDRVMQVLNPTITKAAAATRDYDSSKKGLINTLFGAAQKAFFFGSVIGHVASTLKGAFTMMEDAARTNAAKKYFDDSGKSIEELRVAARGLVSDGDLVKKANLAEAMGLDNNTFKTLLATAQAAAAKTGQSFDHMFDSIVVGTARSSRLLLDNLGIIVSVDQANRAYAEQFKKDARYQHLSIEKIVESFTAEQKQIAFIEETARKAAPTIAQMNALGDTGAEKYDRFSASIKNLAHNLGTEMGEVLSGLIGYMNTLLGQMNKFFERGKQAQGRAGTFAGYKGDKVLDGQRGVLTQQYNIPGMSAPISVDANMGERDVSDYIFQEASKAADALMDLVEIESEGRLTAEQALRMSTTEVVKTLSASGGFDPALLNTIKQLDALEQVLGRNVVRLKEQPAPSDTSKAPGDLEGVGGGGGGGGGIEQRAKTLSILDRFQRKWEKEFEKEAEARGKAKAAEEEWIKDFYGELAKAEQKKQEDERKLREKAAEERQKYDEAVFNEEMRLLQSRADNLAELDRALADVIKGAGGVLTGSTGLGVAVGAAAGGALGAAAGAPQAGAALGELFGTMMDKLPGMEKISGALSGGFLRMFEIGFGPLVSLLSDLEQPIFTLMAALGTVISAGLDPFVLILRAVMPGLTAFLNFVAGVIVAGSVFLGLLALMTQLGMGFVAVLQGLAAIALGDILGFGPAMSGFVKGLSDGTIVMLGAFVSFHNAILTMIRKIPGLDKYGTKLLLSQILPDPPEPTDAGDDDNGDALDENTRALRDLARELHNLPSGYKGSAAFYNASDNEAPAWMGRFQPNRRIENPMGRTIPRANNPFR